MDRMDPDPELDALVKQLNESQKEGQARTSGASDEDAIELLESEGVALAPRARARRPEWQLPKPGFEERERISELLRLARERGATDLYLVSGQAAALRVDGRLSLIEQVRLGAEEMGRLCAALVPERRRDDVMEQGSVDFAISEPGIGRLRGNVHRERQGWAVSLRLLPAEAPSLESLNLPEEVSALGELRHGLVLVSGPTGSGKSSTLAALLRAVMSRRACHVITIEDPIEYVHAPPGSLVEQVEVGRDSPSFSAALRSALRQDPDVLMVGEMRDADSMAMTLTAAETGHLVLSTLHTGGAAQTLSRIVDAHPAGDELVRAQLAASLEAVVSQQLVPTSEGEGRVPVVEVLRGNDAVRNLIRKGQLEQIGAQVGLGKSDAMLTFDASLAMLVKRGLIEYEDARRRARHPREFELLLR